MALALVRRLPALLEVSSSSLVQSRSHTGYIEFQGRFDARDDPRIRYLTQARRINLEVRREQGWNHR